MECKGHSGPVVAVDAMYSEGSKVLIASSSSDSTVRLWLYSDNKEGNKPKKTNSQGHLLIHLLRHCVTSQIKAQNYS